MVRCFSEQRAAAVIAFERVPMEEVHRYGIAKPKKDGEVFEIEDLVEKPTRQEAASNLAIAARYVFAPQIFGAIKRTPPGKTGEIQITDAIRLMMKDGGKVFGVCLRADERRYDIGNFLAYFRAFVEFALEDEKHGLALRKHLEALLDHHP
jgi:UTP--glucose-1-phosphate uridylyltransferase